MMKNTGIILVSFGSTDIKVREASTSLLLSEVRAKFNDCLVEEAFSGEKVREKIFKESGEKVLSPWEALEKFKSLGIENVILQNTFLMEGGEYKNQFLLAQKYGEAFKSVKVGKPITCMDSSRNLSDALIDGIIEKDEFTVLAGHGSIHEANKMYFSINAELEEAGFTKAFVGTLENKPDIGDVLAFLKDKGAENVTLMPLLSVAGNHSVKDIFGAENSYLSKLKDAGCKVKCVKKGLSEYKVIRDMWIRSIEEIMEEE